MSRHFFYIGYNYLIPIFCSDMRTFVFPRPPSLNEIIDLCRRNKYEAARSKKQWTNKSASICRWHLPLPHKYWIAAEIGYQTTTSDGDNLQTTKKTILDGFVEAGLIATDNLTVIQSPIVDFFVEQKTPQVKLFFFEDKAEFLSFITTKIEKS